ncbi:MAG TPA: two-component regulator propeller domain-containing protein, partial [Anaerolineales bacterium]|nr:two-component regulator propeller domain-containing protein [Anaerolineales bacterium]
MSTTGVRIIIIKLLVILVVSSILFSRGFILPVSAQTDAIRFETISTEQGLSQSTVNAILQDRQGFLWFATEGGLNEYDGYQFTVFQHDPDDPRSLTNNLVTSMFEDRDGRLWIGTSTGLDRLDRSSGTFIHFPISSTGSGGCCVQAISQDLSGTLWVGTGGAGLYALDPTTNRLTVYKHDRGDPHSLSDDFINTIYLGREGDLWIGTDGGLDRFDAAAGSFTHDLQNGAGSSMPGNSPVHAIYEDGQGSLWIGTMAGLVQWDRPANRFVLYQQDPNAPESLSDDAIRCIYQDSQANLWIGTRTALDQFDPAKKGFIHFVH